MQDVGFATCNAEVETDSIRVATHDDREHLVAPVVAVREMVLKGEFLPAEEIRASAPAWNGRVLPIGHPTTDDGEFTSANSPEVHDEQVVGKFFGAAAPDGQLTGEIWVDIERSQALAESTGDDRFAKPLAILASHADGEAANAVDADTAALAEGDLLEVSTAYFYNRKEAVGTHEGESYDATQHNLRPDHLALLPNSVGECSVEDGCGAPRAHVHANVGGASNERVAGVEFSGTADGSLNESALDPDEHTLSDHYLYGSGDSKSDFSYPVVDAEGQLRRGNVTSAWELGCRGQCDSDDAHRRRVRALAREFENVPDFAQDDGQNAQHFGVTPNGDAASVTNHGSMNPEHIEWLASHTEFDRETLETFEESHLETLKASVESAAGGHAGDCHCNECGGAEQDGQTNSGDGDAGDDGPEATVNVEMSDEVEEAFKTLQAKVDELESKLSEQEQAERAEYVETIVENSQAFDDPEDLAHIDDTDTLASMAAELESRQANADMSGRIGAGGAPGGSDDDTSDYLALAKKANPTRFGDPEPQGAD